MIEYTYNKGGKFMNEKTKKGLITVVALILFVGASIGIGFIWNLFWKVDFATTLIYWITKGIINLLIVVFALFLTFGKADKGISAMQLFFSVVIALLPLVLRAICMIPAAGMYIAILLAFVFVVFYAFVMLGLASYGKGEGNKKI